MTVFFNKNKTLGIFSALLLSYLLLWSTDSLSAQETIVVGQVVDKYDKTPLSSVDVFFKNSNIAVQTNEEGYFMIRTNSNHTTLVFSLLGFKRQEIKLKAGKSVGLQMELEEKQNYLFDVFVLPGANPANDLMRKVRAKRKDNNVSIEINSSEQSAVFLSKKNFRWENNRLFSQFKTGNITANDSSFLLPLYLEQSEYTQHKKNKKLWNKDTYNTPKAVSDAVSQLLNGIDEKVNFYENSIPVLGQSIVSPLANIGSHYYIYYLKDSLKTDTGKQYEVQFWSKNFKNLALNGIMMIDSATWALVKIDAELPQAANINFIHHFFINQQFTRTSQYWIPQSEQTRWNLTSQIISDTLRNNSELLISRNTTFDTVDGDYTVDTSTFAATQYSQKELSQKVEILKETPLFKMANYIADVVFTSNMKVGKFDIPNVVTIARLTEQEGLRLSLPVQTNEDMWKNLMLGGMIGYGLGDKQWKYSGDIRWRLPTNKNMIAGMHYQKDYHWMIYDKNDFLWRENPYASYDENIATTILSLQKGTFNTFRENISLFVKNDWNEDVETRWIVGNERIAGNGYMPFIKNGIEISNIKTQYFTLVNRISFNERTINDHLQRKYLRNNRPVIYAMAEIGEFALNHQNGLYGNLMLKVTQQNRFVLGKWKYFVEAGKIFGNVPYPLLKFFSTKTNGGYGLYQFSLMNHFEYPMDTYLSLHTELITNGIIFNQLPILKHLNIREMATYRIGYGTLSNSQTRWMDFPPNSTPMKRPYSEISVGFTNFLKILTFQSVWRLSDLNKKNIKPWGYTVYISIGF